MTSAATTRNPLAGLPRPTRRQALALLGIALGSILLSFLLDALIGDALPLHPEPLRDWLRARGALGPLVYIGLLALAVVVTPIPSIPLDIASGLAYGVVWGTLYTLLGAELGALIAFGLARRFGRPWLARHLPAATLTHIDAISRRLGGRGLFLTRLLPVFNFDWVSYAAGLTDMSWRVYALGTLLGMLAPVIAIVAVGDALVSDPGRAALIFGVLALLVVAPLLWWSVRPARPGAP